MNIGSLFRGIMGDSKPGEAKQMELKEGQVVRGVVTSVSEDGQEAVVQIQGVKVRAKLETPLQQGATTLLQVQPPGKDGMPVLKPVTANTTGQQPAASMNDLLESMSLPDTKDNREMITQMRSAGIPLTAENAKNIQVSLTQKPSSVPLGEWVQSAAVAIQRGLPVTGQSVAGLQQAIFGPPLHESLDNLNNLLRTVASQMLGNAALADQAAPEGTLPTNTAAAQSNTAVTSGNTTSTANSQQAAPTANTTANANTATTAGLSTGTAQLLDKLQHVIRQLNSLIPQAEPNETAPQSNATVNNQNQSPTAEGQQASATANTTTPTTTQGSTNSSPWLGQVMKLLGAEYEQQTVRAALTLTSTPPSTEQPNGQPAANANPANSNASSSGNHAAEQAARNITGNTPPPVNNPLASSPIPNPSAPVPPQAPQVPNGAQTASAAASLADIEAPDAPQTPLAPSTTNPAATNNEQTATQPSNNNTANLLLRGTADSTDAQPDLANLIPASHASAEETIAKAQDTLKGLLLQLSNADDAPPALKDAAQQLVQQLTGQQLLLNTDRTAPFAQVTMFVPFNGPDGQETASVQIQSQRGGKGELDASNCRLWFDLDMKSLGQTLLDVQVVDRIVTLKVHNDQEQLAPFVESKKQEISDAIGNLGYQLLSLQFAPLPVRSTTDSLLGTTSNDITDQYAPPEYKGVDMKI